MPRPWPALMATTSSRGRGKRIEATMRNRDTRVAMVEMRTSRRMVILVTLNMVASLLLARVGGGRAARRRGLAVAAVGEGPRVDLLAAVAVDALGVALADVLEHAGVVLDRAPARRLGGVAARAHGVLELLVHVDGLAALAVGAGVGVLGDVEEEVLHAVGLGRHGPE